MADIRQAREKHPGNLRKQLQEMTYFEAWIWESIRHFCPVPASIRVLENAPDPFTLTDGSVCPLGSRVLLRHQVYSWNPKIWDSPREFRVDRHLGADGKLSIKPAHEFPVFFGGARGCLGKKMAFMNTKLVLSEILTRFDLSLDPSKPEPAHLWLITSKVEDGL